MPFHKLQNIHCTSPFRSMETPSTGRRGVV